MSKREEKFEKMLKAILAQYDDVVSKMEKLKAEDKTKTVTYKHDYKAFTWEYACNV